MRGILFNPMTMAHAIAAGAASGAFYGFAYVAANLALDSREASSLANALVLSGAGGGSAAISIYFAVKSAINDSKLLKKIGYKKESE
jgi:hypothetical protein